MMTHATAQPLLHDLLDGHLDPATHAAVTAHAAACPDCTRELAELQNLRDAATALPAGTPPGRDLWPGIAARLADRVAPGDPDVLAASAAPVPGRHRRPRSTWLAAAVVALAMLLPWLRPDTGPLPGADALDADYAQVRRDGERLLDTGALPPVAAAELRDGMGTIDHAVDETRHALERAVAAPDQFRRLTEGYRRKIDLLRQVVDRAART